CSRAPARLALTSQNCTRTPTWMFRDPPPSAPCVEVTRPKFAFDTTSAGFPKFGWLNRFENEPSRFKVACSRIAIDLRSLAEKLGVPGPTSCPGPTFPKRPMLLAGMENALGSNHVSTVRCPLERLPYDVPV